MTTPAQNPAATNPKAVAETIVRATETNADAMAHSGKAALADFHELTSAYQSMASKNAEKLTQSIQALSAVKTPTEFFELQQKLIKEGIETAMADSRKIAELTTSLFSAAAAPLKAQVDSLHKH